ncbi:MAG: choice-of-anchor M domain-containing protein [Planctomycetia bacterium]
MSNSRSVARLSSFSGFARIVAAAVAVSVSGVSAVLATPYELDLHLHSNEVTPSEFAASDALLPVKASAKGTRPAGSQWDFIGVSAGQSVWRLPKTQNTDLLWLSLGTEELRPADFSSTITWSLLGVTGSGGGAAPGVFSMWNVDDFGGIIPLMSTAPGAGVPNSLLVAAGGHYHYNYAFTQPGLYNVTFLASGNLSAGLGGGTVSGSATYSFGVFDTGADYVEPTSLPWTYQGQQFSVALFGDEHIDMGVALVAVPEPSSLALAGLGAVGAGLAALRSRRRRAGRRASSIAA